MALKVLVACEESQAVCKAFRELGHEAYSCDIQECSGGHPEWHIQDDVLRILNGYKGRGYGCPWFTTNDGETMILRIVGIWLLPTRLAHFFQMPVRVGCGRVRS